MKINKFKKLFKSKKLLLGAAALALLAVIILIVPGREQEEKEEVKDSAEVLEEKLCELCENIKGIDKAYVMVTLDSEDESEWATDKNISSDYESFSLSNVSGEAVKVKSIAAKVRGVGVVCTDGDKGTVKKEISEMISAVLGIPISHVKVLGIGH